jgi:Domain of Unknown Function (DUF748)
MKVLKKILRSKLVIISAAALISYTLAGFFLAPWLVRHYVPKIAHEQLKRQAAIGEVRINPFIFTVDANDFRMEEPDGQPIVGFKRLFVDFELKSLFKWAWTFREVRLEGPHVNAVIAKDGALNLAGLAPPAEEPPQPPEKEHGPPPLIVEEVSIDDGRIDFTDQRQSQPASINLESLQLHINNLTTLPGQEGPKTITTTLGDGGTLRWTGEIGLNPVATQGSFAIENVKAATAWKFMRDAVNLEQPAGTVSITADYNVDLSGAEPQVTLGKLAVALTGLTFKLEGAGAPFFELPDARLTGGRLDLAKHEVDIEKLAITGGRAGIRVDESGALNLERILRDTQKPAPPLPPSTTAGAAKPWTLNLAALNLSGFAADYEDHSRTPGLKAGVGEIKTALKARVEAGGRTQVVVNDIGVTLSGFRAALAGDPEPSLQIERIGLAGGAYDLQPNAFSLETVSVEGGVVDMKRLTDGEINLALLFAPPQKGAVARGKEEAAAEGHPFQFVVKAVTLSGFQVKFSDFMVKPEAPIINLEDMTVSLTNVDGKSPMPFDVGLNVREGGQIKANGTINPAEPAVESDIEVSKLELAPFQPYLGRAAAVDLQSGTFSTRGTLRHGIQAAGGGRTTYQGRFRVGNLRVTEAGQKETLVGWRSLATDQLKLQLEPNRLDIGDLRVALLTGKFIIEKDHSINLANVIKSGTEPKKVETQSSGGAAGPADPFPYRIHRILLSEGRVDFADLSLPTPFGTKIDELKGIVAGISSARDARAQVELDGRVNEYGTAKINGELNTADPKTFTDIGVIFRNLEMSSLTPYSGKFAGRKIDSGKLSVDLKYKITKGQLAGDNQIVVDRLVLGEKVESPEAVDLPLDLAVALLEDSNGVIDLGLPVKGDLNSPEFSFGAVVWKAFVNLLTKIVTSPFRALGALVPGGGEESLNSVAFEPGRPDVPPPEQEKLVKLGIALQKRPQLKLIVQGRYNPDTDLKELRTASLRRTLAVSLGRKLRRSSDPGPVDFGSPETGKALEAMFAERFGNDALKALTDEQKTLEDKAKKEAAAKGAAAQAGGDPKDPGQFAKALFARLAESEPIGDPELTQLAEARAQAIVAELVEAGRLPAERIEVKPPAALDKKDPVSALLSLEAGR